MCCSETSVLSEIAKDEVMKEWRAAGSHRYFEVPKDGNSFINVSHRRSE